VLAIGSSAGFIVSVQLDILDDKTIAKHGDYRPRIIIILAISDRRGKCTLFQFTVRFTTIAIHPYNRAYSFSCAIDDVLGPHNIRRFVGRSNLWKCRRDPSRCVSNRCDLGCLNSVAGSSNIDYKHCEIARRSRHVARSELLDVIWKQIYWISSLYICSIDSHRYAWLWPPAATHPAS